MTAIAASVMAMTTRLGRYTVLGRIAAGSTANVLLADVDPGHLIGRPHRVVLKQLHPHFAENDEFVRMFLDEIQLLSRFDDDGIVRVFDLDEDDGHAFAVLQLTDGPSLAAALRLHAGSKRHAGPGLPVDVVVAVAARIARALQVVHTLSDADGCCLDVVHRDVTIDNVLVGRDGSVRLADFGIARSVVGRSSGVLVGKETTAGTKKGKANVLAPEQVLGPADRITARTDLYGLGATLWTLLAGRPPFSRAHGDVALFEAIVHTPAPRLGTVIEIDPALETLVASLLEKRSEDRPDSAAAVAVTLQAWCDDHDVDSRAVVGEFVVGLGLPSLLC